MNRVLGGFHEPESWAQSIQAYQRDKTTLSWNVADVPPPSYVKQFDVSRKSREVDPVLMRHRDPDVEATRQEREGETLRATLNKAKSRQQRVEQNYNIVNHRSHVMNAAGQGSDHVKLRHPSTRTPYDIVNHVPRDHTHSLLLIYPEGESPEVLPQKAVTVEGGKKPHSHLKRDVNVLSNRFLENHDEKMYEEGKFIREQAAERYRRTHGYNLIAGKYYDDKKEEEFLRTREELETLQGRAQHHRLPPSIRYGEGNEYDIISKKTKGQAKKSNVVNAADRGLGKRAHGRELYEESIHQHQRAAVASEERGLNRPSHQRHAERQRVGYDVISNQVFFGREGRPPPPPRARPPESVWDRLAGPAMPPTKNNAAGVEKESAGNPINSVWGGRDRSDALDHGSVSSGDERISNGQGDRDGRDEATTSSTQQIVPPLDLSRKNSIVGS